ncbi:methyltransferase domain-containing protein [Streptomyces sp. NPDC050617]|uniref:class I SAM-dependent methyltransferase n=1 Tax=Streptomyces sp. NPDC050617 TaxID=3154628 RepID=UPI003421F5BA
MGERAHGPARRGEGTGPGAFTPDGNAVELYSRLPAGTEPETIARVVPPGASILELGAGAGRVTHALLERGYRIVAVDESEEMLSRVKGARTVHSSIEALDLGERFDAVLLASHLLNTVDPSSRDAMVRSCRRHVADSGRVLVERQGDDWFESRMAMTSAGRTRADIGMRIVSVERSAPGVADVRIEYEADGARWTHSFRAWDVPDAELERILMAAGLRLVRYLTDDHSWVEAVPV